MLIRRNGFNLYLVLIVALGLATGCKTTGEDKKPLSTLRLYLEAKKGGSKVDPKADPFAGTETVEVDRANKMRFTIAKDPFLTEALVKEAKVIDDHGGYALQVQFDSKGTWLLEEYTGANRSRHILVSSQFFNPGEEKINLGRWLAAPVIRNHITDGLFVFTPDATREEAERIALGLNHVAKILATGRDLKL
jgi:preprotein translocase subunit SecD